MGIIGYIFIGLIMGILAKAVLPGRANTGWLGTILLGIVGAVVGGLLGNAIFGVGLENFWSIQTWVIAFLGTVLVLVIYGALTGRKKA